MNIRTLTAVALSGLALAGAACGGDDDDESANPGGKSDAPVNTDTPSADPEGSTPAPNENSPQGETSGGG
jgi:hypothetical protein